MIYLSELFLLVYIIMFKTVVLEHFTSFVNILNIVFLGILALLSYKFLGFPKKKSLVNYNAMQKIVICFIVYYVLIYIFGLFLGFLRNAYSLKILSILSNLFVAAIVYVFIECYRYMVANKSGKGNFIPYILVTILIASLNIIMGISAYDLGTGSGIIEFIEGLVLPQLALSSLLSYISYKYDYKLSILFLFIFDLPKYFLPIIPDLGIYIKSMVNLVFIFVCYYQLSLIMEKYERKITVKRIRGRKIILPLIIIPLLVLIGLVSGAFKYHLFAIGSNSMVPTFAKGDAVLIEKLRADEYDSIKKGEILAFKYNKQIIVHRVYSIKENNGLYQIKTKGDNNDSVDVWTVENKDIYGKGIYVVKYIGIPSVELSERMS